MTEPDYVIERGSYHSTLLLTVWLNYQLWPGCTTQCRVRVRIQHKCYGEKKDEINDWVLGPSLEFLENIGMTSDKLLDWLCAEIQKEDKYETR